MNLTPQVHVNGESVNPLALWPHFGSKYTDGFETDYIIQFSTTLAPDIVGDYRDAGQSWLDLIRTHLRWSGSMQGYLEAIARLTGAEPPGYKWVAVGVSQITDEDGVITITGPARRILKHLGIPKSLPLE
jgi:hypothetical protein